MIKTESHYDGAKEFLKNLNDEFIGYYPPIVERVIDAATDYLCWYEGDSGVHQAGYYSSYEEGAEAWMKFFTE